MSAAMGGISERSHFQSNGGSQEISAKFLGSGKDFRMKIFSLERYQSLTRPTDGSVEYGVWSDNCP